MKSKEIKVCKVLDGMRRLSRETETRKTELVRRRDCREAYSENTGNENNKSKSK